MGVLCVMKVCMGMFVLTQLTGVNAEVERRRAARDPSSHVVQGGAKPRGAQGGDAVPMI